MGPFGRTRPALSVASQVASWLCREAASVLGASKPEAAKMFELSRYGLEFRRQAVDQYLRNTFGASVQAGPFEGMAYIPHAAGSLFGPKILGSYEQELAAVFEHLDRYETFVDVGCAEGYFAVGSLVAHRGIRTIAFDIDPKARRLCAQLAAENGVADRLDLRERCEPATLVELAQPKTLIMVDIEGAELDFLKDIPADRLRDADLVIETHWVGDACTLEFLADYFSATHTIEVVEQSARDPSRYPPLMALGQVDRFLAQWEGRGPEPWIIARRKANA